jgi:ABC-type lipoprotein release transport system permease subunit
MLIQLAFKNITRNKKRTLLTMTAVIFGVLLVIVATSFNEGLGSRTVNMFINADTGGAKVVSRRYELEEVENPLDYPIDDYSSVIAALRDDHRIEAISPRIMFRGSLSNSTDEISLTGIGVEPAEEERVFQRSRYLTDGSFLKGNPDGIVIGQKLGELLNLTVGDTVTVIARASQMGYNAVDLEIVGLIKTDNPVIDENSFFVTSAFARDFLSFTSITDIAIAVKKPSQINAVIKDFGKRNLKMVKMMSWKYFARDVLSIIEIQNMKIAVLSFTILLMGGAGITNTMLMAMMERKKEVANFMAQGVRRSEIIKLFLFEGLAIGFLGSFIGLILGAVTVGILRVSGASFGGAPPVFNPAAGLGYFLIGIVLATFSTIYPADQAAKLLPVNVLRDFQG